MNCFLYYLYVAGVLLLNTLYSSQTAAAQETIEIPRIEGSVTLDGLPDEPVWEKIEPLRFTSYYPEAGREPTEHSDVRIGYMDDYLYVGARLYDSEPSLIHSTSYKRDHSGWRSDFFGIILDTHNNNETGMSFFVIPSGARTDFLIPADASSGIFKFDWNSFWDAEVVQNEEGWFTEMRIPFSSLRYQIKDGDVVMGLNVVRWIARKNESSVYPEIPNKWGILGQFKPSQAQKVIFKEMTNHNPLYVAPYLLGGIGQQHLLDENGTAYHRNDEFTYDIGLDVKYGLTSNLTFDLTLNTDFAQVEADNQQVNLTRFSLFFPEKREFFQERSNLFDFDFGENNRLFYSRRIGIHQGEEVRILGGARLTGSIGDWDLGVINMQTAREQELPSENFGVLRLRRQLFNDYSWGGIMITSRIGADGRYNYAVGADGIFRLFGDTYLLGNAAQTLQDGQCNRLLDSEAMRVRLQMERRNIEGFGYNLEYSRSGRAYNPGIGFELREDFTKWGNRLFYGWFAGEESVVQNVQISMYGWGYHRNTDSTAETIGIGPMLEVETKSGSSWGIGPGFYYQDLLRDFEILDGITIPEGSYSYFPVIDGYYQTPSSNLFSVSNSISMGRFYDGYRWSVDISPTWSVSPRLLLRSFYQINHLNFPKRDDTFTAHIGRLRLEYYFSTEFSVSTFAQYSNASERVTTNVRLRYNPREGNDLYIVYNEGLNADRLSYSPVRPFSNNRTILLKYTYTFKY